ncbi:xanthine dehydrogenase accessory factor [Haloactinospora alba]|uniref:Xanthine dehydrogenase accessory factor n=1 Tax=Haloactinospora alba TaxID=405555 RepID=A0A543NJL7_9ACTN|nr:XdhC/CoxI family protein [Haloactinospora alba]TQN32007.1 xanthine dehydrogenase accessory factor [Haloactinospora alba]
MRDIRSAVTEFYDSGETFALATVIDTYRSAPREAGAALAVSASGEVAGSVSGGCVEGAVYELAQQVMATGEPVCEQYGITDEDAFASGLTCGGVLRVFVEPVNPRLYPQLSGVLESIAVHEPVAVVTLVSGAGRAGKRRVVRQQGSEGTLGSGQLDAAVDEEVRGALAHGGTEIRRYGPEGQCDGDEVEVFVQSFTPPPRMLVFGAIDFAAAVADIGSYLGYHVTVCDARPVFVTSKRFPTADEVVVRWPHVFLEEVAEGLDERTAICVLTHDPKFDVPALQAAFRTRAGYIGAMGSRRTHEDRLARLRAAGVDEADLDRLCSPIGLDLGARTPEETAVSVAAELIQGRRGGSGRPLRTTSGRIHSTPLVGSAPSAGDTDDRDGGFRA